MFLFHADADAAMRLQFVTARHAVANHLDKTVPNKDFKNKNASETGKIKTYKQDNPNYMICYIERKPPKTQTILLGKL